MADKSLQILRAVITRVKSQVTGLNNRVYTMTPQNTMFPYCHIRMEVVGTGTKTNDIQEFRFIFAVYTQNGAVDAMTKALEITANIKSAIDRYDFTVTDGHAILCRYDGLQNAIVEDDGLTVQSISRFKILISSD